MTSLLRTTAHLNAWQKATVGDTKISFTDRNHMGWVKCDGSLLSKEKYYLLYRVIGDTFNLDGDDESMFRLPDPRGRVLGMIGQGSIDDEQPEPLSLREKGDYVGEEKHKLTIPELARHNHGTDEGIQDADNDLTGDYSHNHTTSGGVIYDGILTTTSGEGAHTHEHNGTGRYDPINNRDGDNLGFMTQDGNNTMNAPINEGDEEPNLYAGITALSIDASGSAHQHTLTIPTDTHRHILNAAGNDVPHNTMQPTLFYGNLFIYSGRTNVLLDEMPLTDSTTPGPLL